METCSTCRFWQCGEKLDTGWRECWRATRSDHARMQVDASDPWGLRLWTAPDFGCRDWQPIGDGIPTRLRRAGYVWRHGVSDERRDAVPDPDFPANARGLAEDVDEARFTRSADGVVGAYLSIDAFDEESLDVAWRQAVTELQEQAKQFPVRDLGPGE